MREPKPVEDESPAALRTEAAHARRLASACHDGLLRAQLMGVADEFDGRADAMEGRGGGSDPRGRPDAVRSCRTSRKLRSRPS
jgi:hypothetical protein